MIPCSIAYTSGTALEFSVNGGVIRDLWASVSRYVKFATYNQLPSSSEKDFSVQDLVSDAYLVDGLTILAWFKLCMKRGGHASDLV